jgi:hypothetical protein
MNILEVTSSGDCQMYLAEADAWSPLTLAENSQILRDPPRAPEKRQDGYEEQFDFHTLFYDAFLWKEGRGVRLVGPKLFNLLSHVRDAHISLADDPAEELLPFYLHEKRKVAYLDIELPEAVSTPPRLKIDLGALGQHFLQPGCSNVNLFRGHRVAFTLFKFEPNHWLRDWAWFNVKYHGATALMVYHNACEDRTTRQILEVLKDIPGLKLLLVANWPYPYGPSDGGYGEWDSNFCQLGMFEQMHWRFLQEARSVLNTDIDELVVTQDHVSVFEMVEQSTEKHIKFIGHWISGADPVPSIEDRRHKDFALIVEDAKGKLVEEKWALVPSAFGEIHRWGVHGIAKFNPEPVPASQAAIRHFCTINTGWKLDRSTVKGVACKDELLLDAYKRVGWI